MPSTASTLKGDLCVGTGQCWLNQNEVKGCEMPRLAIWLSAGCSWNTQTRCYLQCESPSTLQTATVCHQAVLQKKTLLPSSQAEKQADLGNEWKWRLMAKASFLFGIFTICSCWGNTFMLQSRSIGRRTVRECVTETTESWGQIVSILPLELFFSGGHAFHFNSFPV